MRLYNRTRCPDDLLRVVLVAAARAVSCRTADTIVRVTGGSCSGGRAWGRGWVSRGWLVTHGGKRRLWHDGNITLILPYRHSRFRYDPDPLSAAQAFYRTACHEWAHVRDFRKTGSPDPSTRRLRWADRPQEQSAMAATDEALEREANGQLASRDEPILMLAVWIESALKGIGK